MKEFGEKKMVGRKKEWIKKTVTFKVRESSVKTGVKKTYRVKIIPFSDLDINGKVS